MNQIGFYNTHRRNEIERIVILTLSILGVMVLAVFG